MKVLITGISGFVGSHLADYLLSLGIEVYGTIRHRSKLDNIIHIKNKLKLFDCNVTDAISVMQVIKEIKPDKIHHLAAQSFVPTSWKAPQDTLQTNVIGTVNILEAVREYCPKSRIHIVGSSEEYGKWEVAGNVKFDEERGCLVKFEKYINDNSPDKEEMYECRINEETPLKPLSPYGISKVAQDLLGQQYCKSYGMNIVITRAFNHEGPRRGEVFVTSDFAQQLVEIERENRSILFVGNIDAIRDFTDVRDVVKAYWLVAELGKIEEVYNICSGKGIRIKQLLKMFVDLATVREYVVAVDKDKLRPSDIPILVGDNTKIKELGWKQEVPLQQTVVDILEYWRSKL